MIRQGTSKISQQKTTLRNVGTYFSALWNEAGPRVAVTIVSAALAALTEGALLLMLAPLLSVAGLSGKTAMTGKLAGTLRSVGLFDLLDRVGETGLIGLWIAACDYRDGPVFAPRARSAGSAGTLCPGAAAAFSKRRDGCRLDGIAAGNGRRNWLP